MWKDGTEICDLKIYRFGKFGGNAPKLDRVVTFCIAVIHEKREFRENGL